MRQGRRLTFKSAVRSGIVSILALVIVDQSIVCAQSPDWREAYHDASSYYEMGDPHKALLHVERALALAESSTDTDPGDLAQIINLEAVLLDLMGRSRDAEALYRRALRIRETSLGSTDPRIAESLNNLAVLLNRLGRHAEARTLHLRALEIREQALGTDHPDLAQSLNNLASVELALGRADRAGPLLRRAVAILAREREQTFALFDNRLAIPDFGQSDPDADDGIAHVGKGGATMSVSPPPSHRAPGSPSPSDVTPDATAEPSGEPLGHASGAPGSLAPSAAADSDLPAARQADLAVTLLNLGMMAQTAYTGPRRDEAALLYRRAIEIQEKALGADHPDVALSLNNLAELSIINGQFSDAESMHLRALAIREAALGASDPLVAQSLTNLARLYGLMGRPRDAVALLERSVEIAGQGLGEGHPQVALSVRSLALAHASLGEMEIALSLHRRATELVLRQASLLDAETASGEQGGGVNQGHLNFHLQSHLSTLYQAMVMGIVLPEAAEGESLDLAQHLGDSAAGRALTQLVARFSSEAGELADAVRRHQDLATEWRTLDAKLLSALGATKETRNTTLLVRLRKRLAGTEQKLASLTSALRKDFPSYAQLAQPEPARIDELQALLQPDEALIVFQLGRYGSYAWLITQRDVRWRRLQPSRSEITRMVRALRCGLDRAAWRGSGWEVCQQLLQRPYDWDAFKNGAALPFDFGAAHDLYRGLLSPFEDLLKDKSHLLVVPAAPISSLPLQVLLEQPPAQRFVEDPAGYADAPWLIRRLAITVLPSAGSLKGLRAQARMSRAERAYVAFANPLLAGRPSADNAHARRAKDALLKRSCPDNPDLRSAPEPMSMAGFDIPEAIASLFRGDLGDPDRLREIVPLPETADEVCAIRQTLGASQGDVMLGAKATESTLKALDRSHELSNYRIIHFATHGFLANETGRYTDGLAEPSLILTPPASASPEDDGLLTASEVALLNLDADWVILSACNTAGSAGVDETEALSGLARAFFYAGARSLLVSHWYVDSMAAVKLTTGAFAELRRDPSMRHAEAFRRSMLATMSDPDRPKSWISAAHPAIWAAFSTVGEATHDR